MNILIQPSELQQLARQGATSIFDCRFNLADKQAGQAQYNAGHIPGAFYADLDQALSDKSIQQAGRHPLPAPETFAQYLGSHGVSNESLIVVYDEASGPYAARMFWMCRWIGAKKVRYLDGGIKAWSAAGLPLTKDSPSASPAVFRPDVQSGMIASMEELKRNIISKSFQVLDARDEQRFKGIHEPLDKKAGHIPGASNRHFAKNLAADGRFLDAASLKSQLAGVNPEKTVHSCGSGVTGCHNYLAMEAAGLKGSRLFPGSWSQWCSFPENPVETDV